MLDGIVQQRKTGDGDKVTGTLHDNIAVRRLETDGALGIAGKKLGTRDQPRQQFAKIDGRAPNFSPTCFIFGQFLDAVDEGSE